jgi:hypothetical protein
MTAHTADYSPRFPWWLLAAAIVAALVVANGAHSVAKHGSDALAVHNCLDQPEPPGYELWRVMNGGNKHYECVQLPDGRWGLRVIDFSRWRGWFERTSFVPKEGTYRQLIEYVSARAFRVWPGG